MRQAVSAASEPVPDRSPVVTPQVAAEASVWVARLHGPSRSRAMELECLEWQARSAAHRLAFERCSDTWQDIPRVSLASAISANQTFSKTGPRRSPWREPLRLAAGLVGVFALAVAVSLGVQHWQSAGVYATGVGEQQIVLLADGTRMSLNTASRVRVELTADRRLVNVDGGAEVLFEVAKDLQRPFVVRAGGSEIVAVGTSFSVRVNEAPQPGRDAFAVTLLEGKVTVRPLTGRPSAAHGSPVVMQPGERLRVGSDIASNVVLARDRPRTEQVLAWRRSEAVFDDVSLRDAVDEMNRYSRTPIVLVGDAALGARRISGQFRTGESLAFANAVAALHRLTLRERPGRLELVPTS